MKILITGSSGFIGTNLVNRLESEKFDLVKIDIRDSIRLDIKMGVNHSGKVDSVVHLAALTDVLKSTKRPDDYFKNNVDGLFNCLEYARRNSNHFIFISSAASNSPQLSPYGASKLCGEALCKAYSDTYNLNVDIIRPSNVYGPHSIEKNSVVAKFIRQSLTDGALTVRGDGSQSRSFIYVNDLVEIILRLLKNPSKFKVFEVSDGKQTKILTLAFLIRDIFHRTFYKEPPISFVEKADEPYRVDTYPNIVYDWTKLDTGLRKTFLWFTKNYEKSLYHNL